MNQPTQPEHNKLVTVLWIFVPILFLAIPFSQALLPEHIWVTVLVAVAFLANLGVLFWEYRKTLNKRTTAFGAASFISVILVFGILGVVNFLASKHSYKWDLTRQKLHTLSDQTTKLVKGLKQPVKAVLYGRTEQKDQHQALLDTYKNLSPNFQFEFVNTDKEATRVRAAGIKKLGTLQLLLGTKESKIEDLSEEKITNALVKLLKDKSPTFCAISGHGEKSFESQEAESYSAVKKSFQDQSYEVKTVSLFQEGKVPEDCDAIGVIGPNKSLFDKEADILHKWLLQGGRAIFAIDISLKGADLAPEVLTLLEKWSVKTPRSLIVDPYSKMLGVDAAVPLIVDFSKNSPITKEFTAQNNCFFPISRPLEIAPGAPEGIKLEAIAKTTPNAWGEVNLASISTGQVQKDAGDKSGPLTVGLQISGKLDPTAKKETRIIVFGTSQFASNSGTRAGSNIDLFMNSASWILEDESMISIRAKEDDPAKLELTQKEGKFILWTTVLAAPLLIAIFGIVNWVRRRRL